MERIKRPERIEKMERGLFIIISKNEIPAYRQAGLPVAGSEPNALQLFGRHRVACPTKTISCRYPFIKRLK
jgi:hypothetical protein